MIRQAIHRSPITGVSGGKQEKMKVLGNIFGSLSKYISMADFKSLSFILARTKDMFALVDSTLSAMI